MVHPYTALPITLAHCKAAGYTATPQTLGSALHEVLHEAIESLKPTGSENLLHRAWRAYVLINQQYLQHQEREQIARQLAIDLDTYNHCMADAMDTVSHWLDTQGSAPRQPRPTPAPVGLHTAPPRTRQRLFGRDDLLHEVKTRLLLGEDVALFGLPGIGKSALLGALAYDTDLLTHFSDGVLWAGLGQYADPFVTLGEWARHLGLPRGELTYLITLDQRMAAVRAAIGARKLLLVIDDAWRSEDGLALRLGGPGCVHVFSSRTQATAQACAERNTWPVPELAAPDGLAMLADHAPEVVQAFGAETQRLVASVGGLPLALRLMGSYLQTASRNGAVSRRVKEALARLDNPETRLILSQMESPLERRPGVTRDLTLAEVIGLSETFLDGAAREALAALSVFPPKPNSFDEEAALAVCGEEPAALDALVDASLIEEDDGGRYLVHPVIGVL